MQTWEKKNYVLSLIQVFLPTFRHTERTHQVQSTLVIIQLSASYPVLSYTTFSPEALFRESDPEGVLREHDPRAQSELEVVSS